MQNFRIIIGFIKKISIVLIVAGCIKPYDVDFGSDSDYLVVEGVLTQESKAHEVILSYASGSADTEIRYVNDATVWIEDQDGATTPLTWNGEGSYQTATDFAGTIGNTYRLIIELADGRIISSTPETMRSPTKLAGIHQRYARGPSRNETENIGGIQFFIDAEQGEDPVNYYRYEWTAGYRIDVHDPAFYKLVSDTIIDEFNDTTIINSIQPDPYVLLSCYQADTSSGLIYGSTETSKDRQLLDFPINFVSQESERLTRRYSLLVKQYTISAEAYYYYKKLDESNNYGGSLFDRQTGFINGNLEFESGEDPVIGYFEVASVDSLRQFFNRVDFTTQLDLPNYFFYCQDGVLTNFEGPDRAMHLADSLGRPIYITGYDSFSGTTSIQTKQFCSDCSYYADPVPPNYWIP